MTPLHKKGKERKESGHPAVAFQGIDSTQKGIKLPGALSPLIPLMSLEAILYRVKAIEHHRMKRWLAYTAALWLALWMLYWGLNLHDPSETLLLEDQLEVIEAFAELYPLAP